MLPYAICSKHMHLFIIYFPFSSPQPQSLFDCHLHLYVSFLNHAFRFTLNRLETAKWLFGRIDASFHLTSGFLCVKTRCKTNSGGLQSLLSQEQRQEEEEKSAQRLVAEFPWLLREVREIYFILLHFLKLLF